MMLTWEPNQEQIWNNKRTFLGPEAMPSSKRQRPQFAPRNMNTWPQQQVSGPAVEATMQQAMYNDLTWVQPTQDFNMQYQNHYLQQSQYVQQTTSENQYSQQQSQYAAHFMQPQTPFPGQFTQPATPQTAYGQLYHTDLSAQQLQYSVEQATGYAHPSVQPFHTLPATVSALPAAHKSPRGAGVRTPTATSQYQQPTGIAPAADRHFRQASLDSSPQQYPPRRQTYQNRDPFPRETAQPPPAALHSFEDLRSSVQRPYQASPQIPGRGRFGGRGRWTRGGGMTGRGFSAQRAPSASPSAVSTQGDAPAPRQRANRGGHTDNAKKPAQPAAAPGHAPHLDIKNKLQELLQQLHLNPPTYELKAWDGVSHEPHFRFEASVTIEGKAFTATGSGKTKKDGQREAATKLLRLLREDPMVVAAVERMMQGGKLARNTPHWLEALGFAGSAGEAAAATGSQAGPSTDAQAVAADGSVVVPTLPGTSGQTNLGWVNDAANQPLDIKNRLQELCQKLGAEFPAYHLVRQTGPSHLPMFTVQGSCMAAGITLTREASAASKKLAEKAAAEWLLNTLLADPRIKDALANADRKPFRSPRTPAAAHVETPKVKEEGEPVETPAEVKNKLQELCQKLAVGLPSYEMINRQGPVHDPIFHVRAFVLESGNKYATEGSGRSKKDAEKDAAAKLLDLLNKDPVLAEKLTRRIPEPKPKLNKGNAQFIAVRHELSKLLRVLGSLPASVEQLDPPEGEEAKCCMKVSASHNGNVFSSTGVSNNKRDAQKRATQALIALMHEDPGVAAVLQAKRTADAERAAAAAAVATTSAAAVATAESGASTSADAPDLPADTQQDAESSGKATQESATTDA